ncbi:MAG: potassium channel family protein [Gammaproteobacteria bacterium]
MLINMGIASGLMFGTTVVHAGAMTFLLREYSVTEVEGGPVPPRSPLVAVSGAILVMFVASVLEVLLWAVAYLALGALEGLERAVYFSMVTFTTLGYGDVLLDERWRVLGSFEAANGIIMFGWTTAVVIAVVQRVYRTQESDAGKRARTEP